MAPGTWFLADATSLLFPAAWASAALVISFYGEDLSTFSFSLLSCLASLLRTLSSSLPSPSWKLYLKYLVGVFCFVGGPCPCVLGVDTVKSTKLNII